MTKDSQVAIDRAKELMIAKAKEMLGKKGAEVLENMLRQKHDPNKDYSSDYPNLSRCVRELKELFVEKNLANNPDFSVAAMIMPPLVDALEYAIKHDDINWAMKLVYMFMMSEFGPFEFTKLCTPINEVAQSVQASSLVLIGAMVKDFDQQFGHLITGGVNPNVK
jgi:hypothetical protein